MNRIQPEVRRRWCAAMAMLTVAALAGCGGGGGDPPPPPPPPPPAASTSYTLIVDANPIKATVVADAARQAEMDVPLEGGTLTATGADGTAYALEVPADALYSALHITMAPLTQLQGTPFDGPVRGVRLGPDGLQFFKPVTLRITPPNGQSWPVAQQLPLGVGTPAANGAGTVSLASLDPSSAGEVFKLMHFSSYALVLATKGVNASLEAVRHRLGGDVEERLQAAVGDTMAQLRIGQDEVPPRGDLGTAIGKLMNDYENQVVKPRIAAAGASCAAARLAWRSALALERDRQLLGMTGDGQSVLAGPLIDTMVTVCMQEEYEICRDEHIITRILPQAFQVERTYQLLGATAVAASEASVEKCLRFRVTLESDVQYDETNPDDHNLHSMYEQASSSMEVRFQGLFPRGTGTDLSQTGAFLKSIPAPLESYGYRVVSHDPCSTVSDVQGVNGTLQVAQFDWLVKKQGSAVERASVEDFRISLAPSNYTRASHYTLAYRVPDSQGNCGDADPTTSYEGWLGMGYGQLLQSTTEVEVPWLRRWTLGSGELMATKQVNRADNTGDGTVQMQALMKIHHTPASE